MLALLPAVLLSVVASSHALVPHHASHMRRHNDLSARASYVPRSTSYKLADHYQNDTFFDGWDFFTDADPTNGLVNYVSGTAASKLAYVQDDGTVVIAVDNESDVAAGGNRDSIRISSKKSWDRGLFIADIYAMPHGCSVWPAYWSLGTGADWPDAGEIDIIENVNEATQNQVTLHSGSGCSISKTVDALADVISTTCESANGNNAGCAFLQTQTNTFGHPFNMQAGGVFAHTLEDAGISMWFFNRSAIPADIDAQTPDPSTWGTPTAFFPNTNCDIASHFLAQNLIFDITICGDWAGSAYESSGCPGTCSEAVANKTNFDFAQWKINYVSVYQ